MEKLIGEKSDNKLTSILNEICQLTNFPYGEIWIPNENNNFLEISSNYHVAAHNHQYDLQLFHHCSEDFIMSQGEGLPGRVWLNKKPEWILNVSAESEGYFLRNKIAGVCGVKTGFAIPIIVEEKVLMIMTFFTCELRSYSSECIALAENLANNAILSS